MAIPHLIFKQQAKKRLIGKEGKEKEREIHRLLSEMPGYKTGPYGEIRKWLKSEIQENRQRRGVKSRMFFDVKRQGDAQIVLLGPPNIGKSSLLKKLSSIQIKVADYEFTTLKPIPATVNFGGALVQIVEIPGLLQGASEGRGGGRAMLAAARNANYLVLMTSVDTSIQKVEAVYHEMEQVNLPHPKILICNKVDLLNAESIINKIRGKFPNLEVVPISIEKDIGLQELRGSLWQNLHLIRIFLKNRSGEIIEKPIVVAEETTVADVIGRIRKETIENYLVKIWGPSAKFGGQEVGGTHTLLDGDILEAH